MTNAVFIIAGPSGTGKTFLTDALADTMPDQFWKMTQVTTRARRDGEPEDAYEFITRERYDEIKDRLLCRTDFGGNLYGTYIPEDFGGKIGVAVVNAQGIVDIREGGPAMGITNSVVLYLEHRDLQALHDRVNRPGRGIEFIMQEAQDCAQLADVSVDVTHEFCTVEMAAVLASDALRVL